MKTIKDSLSSVALYALMFGFASACATATPVELVNARTAFSRASAGPAAQVAPDDLHKAKVALDQAEQSFTYGKDEQTTIDLAYIAERTAQIAEAHAATDLSEQKDASATKAYGQKKDAMSKATQADLVKTKEELAAQSQQIGVERSAREAADLKASASNDRANASDQRAAAADQKAADANDALAKLAAKEDARGTIITLSGSVLFRTNDASLLPGASSRLDQVAEALIAKDRNVVVEGYTDSKGSLSTNMSLSQRRAESVRSYLVGRGFPMAKIAAEGKGPESPIADNTSAEGRANNRRVEIVISKQN